MTRQVGSPRWWPTALVAVAKRPELWWVAAVETRSLLARNWWRSWPPLPRPARAWLEFRMETAYGDRRARPSPGDVVAWLGWCRERRQGSVRQR